MMKRHTPFAFVLAAICLAVVGGLFCPIVKAQDIKSQTQNAEFYVQTGHGEPIGEVLFSPDNRLLATGGYDNSVKLWDAETGIQLRTLDDIGMPVGSIAFSPNGKIIAAANYNSNLCFIWNVETGEVIKTFEGAVQTLVAELAFSPDGRLLAYTDRHNSITIRNLATGRVVREIKSSVDENNVASFQTISFHPHGKTLIGVDEKGFVRSWDVATGRRLLKIKAHAAAIVALAVTDNGKTIVTGAADKTIKRFDATSGDELHSFTVTGEVKPTAFSRDAKLLASVGDNGLVIINDAQTGAEIRQINTDDAKLAELGNVTFDLSGETIVSSGMAVKFWNLATGRETRTLTDLTSDSLNIAFTEDGTSLAIADDHNTIKFFDLSSGNISPIMIKTASPITEVEFSKNGKLLAVKVDATPADEEESELGRKRKGEIVVLYETATGRQLKVLDSETLGCQWFEFSPDDKTLAVICGGGVELWNVETASPLHYLENPPAGVTDAKFSPDGKTLAVTQIYTTYLWDAATGSLRYKLAEHDAQIGTIVFSADSKIVATGSKDRNIENNNTIKLHNAESGALLKTFSRLNHTTVPREIETVLPDFARVYFNIVNADKNLAAETETESYGKVTFVNPRTGQTAVTLLTFGADDWLAYTPEGYFDGTPNGWRQCLWRLDNNTFRYAPVEAFFAEFYNPNVLADALKGKVPQANVNISAKDIRQPVVRVSVAEADLKIDNFTQREATIKLEITDAPADEKRKTTSGAKDARLFRNGSLVRVWSGDVLGGKKSVTLTATVPVVAGDNKFTAYAFNNENVKSRDGELLITGADSLKRKGTAYILAIGINEYANSQYNLRYAVADAQGVGEELKRRQEQLGIYERVAVTLLINEHATKAKIVTALIALQGRTQPEDAVIVYFAGHGTAQGNRFYLIPHDLGYSGDRNKVDAAGLKKITEHSVSDLELEAAFERIDAGQLLMVLDACNSGQALEAEEKRRGPMNSKGLAQLAYEKGMYILTAAQSFQAAKEAAQVGHGLLTYALIVEGLKQGVADNEPRDGQIAVREWLDYATGRVPRMQIEKMEAARGLGLDLSFKEEERELDIPRRSGQQPRVFYRRELERQPLIVAKPGASQPQR